MSFKKIPVGKNFPEDVYAIIEISAYSNPIKYEMNKIYNELFVDRFISSSMIYPCNYGYINKTKSLDGDPLDILIPTPHPLLSPSVIQCRPIGMLAMKDESGDDSKIIAVPHNNISNEYHEIQDIKDFPVFLKNQIQNFFENYKNLEKNKWVKIIEWKNKKNAIIEIENSIQRYSNETHKNKK